MITPLVPRKCGNGRYYHIQAFDDNSVEMNFYDVLEVGVIDGRIVLHASDRTDVLSNTFQIIIKNQTNPK